MMIKGRTYCLVLSIISFVYFWLKAIYHLQSNSPEYFPRTFVTNDYIIHALITQIYCVFMCYCVFCVFIHANKRFQKGSLGIFFRNSLQSNYHAFEYNMIHTKTYSSFVFFEIIWNYGKKLYCLNHSSAMT